MDTLGYFSHIMEMATTLLLLAHAEFYTKITKNNTF